MPDVIDFQKIDHTALNFLAKGQFLAPSPRGGEECGDRAGAHQMMAAELDIVEHAKAAEQRNVLEGPRQAYAGARVRTACVRRIESGDGVEKAGLPRTVGS